MSKPKFEQSPASFSPEQVFHGVEWQSGQQPKQVQLDSHSGFMQDANDPSYLYAIRLSRHAIPLSSVTPTMLFNGTQSGKKWNATEGHGLYLTNTPQTNKIMGLRHPNKYIARVRLAPDEILAAHQSINQLPTHQKMAALLLRARGIMPGIPNPGPANWDRLYGNAVAVSYPPLALARPFVRQTSAEHSAAFAQQWMVLRDVNPARIQIVGKYLPQSER